MTAGATSSLQGGILHIEDETAASIRGTSFTHPEATSPTVSLRGGAIYLRGNPSLEDATFESVEVESGGGIQGGAICGSSRTDSNREVSPLGPRAS